MRAAVTSVIKVMQGRITVLSGRKELCTFLQMSLLFVVKSHQVLFYQISHILLVLTLALKTLWIFIYYSLPFENILILYVRVYRVST